MLIKAASSNIGNNQSIVSISWHHQQQQQHERHGA